MKSNPTPLSLILTRPLLGAIALTLFTSCSTAPVVETIKIEQASWYRPNENQFATPSEPVDETATESDANQIERILNKSKTKKGPSCPGLKLVVTCGDGTCNANEGEDINSCAPDCVKAAVVSYNNQTLCTKFQSVFKPENQEEVQTIVRDAVASGKRIKVIGNAHSANQILCSDGIAIVTEKLNRAISIDLFEGEDTVLVESGMLIWDLNEWLYKRGKGIGYSIMGFRAVTIGGAIGTGSHGSSVKHNSVISNIVRAITLVDAQGNVREFSRATTDETTWRALTANFGLLGVITQVRLAIEPMHNLDVKVSYHKEKELFNTPNGVFEPVKDCDFGVMNWFPGKRRFMKVCGKETNKPADEGADNILLNPPLPKSMVNISKEILQLGACNHGIGCLVESLRYTMLKLAPPIQKNNRFGKKVSTRHAVGPVHRMVSSFLTPYQKGFFQMDWEIAVPKSQANGAMAAVLAHIRKNKICLSLVGIFLRFTPSMDETLMSHTTSYKDFIKGEPVVYIEMPVYLPVGFTPEMKLKYDVVFEDFAKLLITHYGARAHWGKNRDWVFEMQRDQDVYGNNLTKFQSVVNALDPKGVFSNDFAKNMGIQYQ